MNKVIYSSNGSFGLSFRAIYYLMDNGYEVPKDEFDDIDYYKLITTILRHNKILLDAFSFLGPETNSSTSNLEVKEINSNKYYIQEENNKEKVITEDSIKWIDSEENNKVVYNNKPGEIKYSLKLFEWLNRYSSWHIRNKKGDVIIESMPRHNQALVRAIELLKKKSNGKDTDLKIKILQGNKYIIKPSDKFNPELVIEPQDINWIEINDE